VTRCSVLLIPPKVGVIHFGSVFNSNSRSCGRRQSARLHVCCCQKFGAVETSSTPRIDDAHKNVKSVTCVRGILAKIAGPLLALMLLISDLLS
jgi:hypothetical protein